MQKLIKEQNYRKDRLSVGLISVLIVIVVILSVTRVILANWLVGSSQTLQELDKKISTQTTVNQSLAENIREKSSLIRLESQAKTMGFIPSVRLTFISDSQVLTQAR